ncbi:hypothetical protein ACSNOI_45720 [Actinomadura kijaniata]|uniref:hypothetical protein n=1 Tax=Actinomadura kijaniata TaxID=46161 RepID=UPI003F1D94EA
MLTWLVDFPFTFPSMSLSGLVRLDGTLELPRPKGAGRWRHLPHGEMPRVLSHDEQSLAYQPWKGHPGVDRVADGRDLICRGLQTPPRDLRFTRTRCGGSRPVLKGLGHDTVIAVGRTR